VASTPGPDGGSSAAHGSGPDCGSVRRGGLSAHQDLSFAGPRIRPADCPRRPPIKRTPASAFGACPARASASLPAPSSGRAGAGTCDRSPGPRRRRHCLSPRLSEKLSRLVPALGQQSGGYWTAPRKSLRGSKAPVGGGGRGIRPPEAFRLSRLYVRAWPLRIRAESPSSSSEHTVADCRRLSAFASPLWFSLWVRGTLRAGHLGGIPAGWAGWSTSGE
jgi:hypothetical protein